METLSTAKFIRLLQSMKPEELKALERWLRSPWCNTNKNLVRLLERVLRYYPGFSDPRLTKEKLFREVLPNGKFSDRRMNNLLSEAYLAAERFLIFQRFSQAGHLQKALLTRELQGRHLNDWFFREADREVDRLNEKQIKSWEDHLHLYRLHRQVYHHPGQGPRLQPGHNTISKMGEAIDLVYALEKAAVINEMISRNRLFKDENHQVRTELEKWRQVSEDLQHPALDLYRMRFAYTEGERLPQYQKLHAAFLERMDALNERDQKIHLLSLLNDAKLLIKMGLLDITDSLPLYQLGLRTGAVLNQGKLTANTYMSIVMAANTRGNFDFTAGFITAYSSRLPSASREDCVHWARAHTAYWQKDLEGCLTVLQGHDFHAPNFLLISRVLATQAYFDLYLGDASWGEYLFNYFDTFEKWLTREKLWSESNLKSFLRFVQQCRKLARFYADVNPKPEKLDNLLKNESNIQALNWLKRKRVEVLGLKTGRPLLG